MDNISKIEEKSKFDTIIDEFAAESELSSDDPIKAAKAAMRKLKLARNFAEIDEKILDLSTNSASLSGGFFTDLLFLEAKRLRFKEEAYRCHEKASSKTEIKT